LAALDADGVLAPPRPGYSREGAAALRLVLEESRRFSSSLLFSSVPVWHRFLSIGADFG
jgi:hypothetical protein